VGPSLALTDGGNVFSDAGITLSNAASPVTVEERNAMTGALVRSQPLSVGSSANVFVLSGTATSEGTATLSADGRFVTVGGYLAAVGTGGIVNAAVPRVIARIGAPVGGALQVDQSTTFSDGFGANNFRGACSNDGTGYWGTGNGSNAGTRYIVHGATGTSTNISNTNANTRACGVFGGQVWVSTGSGTGVATDGGTRIYSVGALPMAQVSTVSYLPGMTNQNPQSFALFDNDTQVAGLDLLYASDTNSGGVRKYVFNGTVWNEITQFSLNLNAVDGGTSGSTCLQAAAKRVGNDYYVLCVTSDSSPTPTGFSTGLGNRVLRYVDVNGTATTSPAGDTVFTAGPFEGLRGVAFSPQ
jgi:hypothetical protein